MEVAKTADIYVTGHDGDDTTPYPTVDIPKSGNPLVFPTPANNIFDGVFGSFTTGDYVEHETGEEILDKPVYEVRIDGDVYDITAYEYHTSDSSTGDRICQSFYNNNSAIRYIYLYAEDVYTDVTLHVVYSNDSVVITASTPVDFELTIKNTKNETVFTKETTISETPVTVRKQDSSYVVE